MNYLIKRYQIQTKSTEKRHTFPPLLLSVFVTLFVRQRTCSTLTFSFLKTQKAALPSSTKGQMLQCAPGGFAPKTGQPKANFYITPSYAVIFGEKLPIKFKEKAKISYETDKYGWRSRTYYPSGILAFVHDNRPYHQKEWLDGKKPLESRLAEILAYFETYAKKEIEERIEWEKRRRIEEEERKRQQELQRKKDDEIRRIKVLINMANYWKQAQILRDYITALENTEGLDIKRMDWIPWAKQKIEWFDPFTQGPDEILDDEDRDKLISELNETKTQTRNNYWHY